MRIGDRRALNIHSFFPVAFLENKNTFRESWDRVVSGSSLVSVIVTARMNLLALFSIFWPLCSTLFFFYFLSILSCASSISTRSLLRITFPSSRTFCQNCRRSESAWRTEGRRSKRFWTWIPGLPDLKKLMNLVKFEIGLNIYRHSTVKSKLVTLAHIFCRLRFIYIFTKM